MTADEWGEIVDWLAERYPDSQYTAEDVIVIFTDLKDFDPSDVWSAVYWFHEQGREFPPNASMLLSRSIEERQKTAREEMYRGAPEARGKPLPAPEPIEWSEYAVKRFGERLSWDDAIARIHAEMRPCN
ncbi:hypothetical protein LCGC14_2718480, partial [marine sediment metagenome]